MISLKDIQVASSEKKALVCRGCFNPIPPGDRHVVLVHHGKNQRGFAYDRKTQYCLSCGVEAAISAVEEIDREGRRLLESIREEFEEKTEGGDFDCRREDIV